MYVLPDFIGPARREQLLFYHNCDKRQTVTFTCPLPLFDHYLPAMF